MSKLKIAQYWGAGCGGCDTATLDVHGKILDLAAAADIVFWPIAVDTKYADVEQMDDDFIDVTLFNGAVRNSENEKLAKLLRRKSKVLVAFGSCAHIGGIPGLANLYNREQVFDRVYSTTPSTCNNGTRPQTVTEVPEGKLELPEFYDTVYTLDQVAQVDYYVPGCPPPPAQIWAVVEAIVTGQLPPAGSVVGASDKTQCDECPRTKENMKLHDIRRIANCRPDPSRCFLEQGLLCMGPATRGGCETRCQLSGVACRGCFGAPAGVLDQGAKALSAIAAIAEADDAEAAKRLASSIDDPLRTLNRFGIPASMLKRKAL